MFLKIIQNQIFPELIQHHDIPIATNANEDHYF